MLDESRTLDAVFFKSENGNEPVRERLRSLTKAERKVIGDDILKVQYCWPIGKPLVGSMSDGLWEVRSRLGDRIGRVFFCIEQESMVLLHGMIKKLQKTPLQDIKLAKKRQNQLR